VNNEKIKQERFSRIRKEVENEFEVKGIKDKDILEETIKFRIFREEKEFVLKEKVEQERFFKISNEVENEFEIKGIKDKDILEETIKFRLIKDEKDFVSKEVSENYFVKMFAWVGKFNPFRRRGKD